MPSIKAAASAGSAFSGQGPVAVRPLGALRGVTSCITSPNATYDENGCGAGHPQGVGGLPDRAGRLWSVIDGPVSASSVHAAPLAAARVGRQVA